VDESEIDSANETAAHGPPFRLWTTVVDARDRGHGRGREAATTSQPAAARIGVNGRGGEAATTS